MSKVNLSLQILPLIEDEKKLYQVVDEVIDYIANTGLDYVVSPMETTVEGEMDEVLDIVKKAQEICVANNAKRIISSIKIDYKVGGITMEEKIKNYK